MTVKNITDPAKMSFQPDFLSWAVKEVQNRGQAGITSVHLILRNRKEPVLGDNIKLLIEELKSSLQWFHMSQQQTASTEDNLRLTTAKEDLAACEAGGDSASQGEGVGGQRHSSSTEKGSSANNFLPDETANPDGTQPTRIDVLNKAVEPKDTLTTPFALRSNIGLSAGMLATKNSETGSTIQLLSPTLQLPDIRNEPLALPDDFSLWTAPQMVTFQDQASLYMRANTGIHKRWQSFITAKAAKAATTMLSFRPASQQTDFPVSPSWYTDEGQGGADELPRFFAALLHSSFFAAAHHATVSAKNAPHTIMHALKRIRVDRTDGSDPQHYEFFNKNLYDSYNTETQDFDAYTRKAALPLEGGYTWKDICDAFLDILEIKRKWAPSGVFWILTRFNTI